MGSRRLHPKSNSYHRPFKYKYYVRKKPYPNREGIMTITAEVGTVLPKASNLKFEDVADVTIMEKLDKSGYIDSLYK